MVFISFPNNLLPKDQILMDSGNIFLNVSDSKTKQKPNVSKRNFFMFYVYYILKKNQNQHIYNIIQEHLSI